MKSHTCSNVQSVSFVKNGRGEVQGTNRRIRVDACTIRFVQMRRMDRPHVAAVGADVGDPDVLEHVVPAEIRPDVRGNAIVTRPLTRVVAPQAAAVTDIPRDVAVGDPAVVGVPQHHTSVVAGHHDDFAQIVNQAVVDAI